MKVAIVYDRVNKWGGAERVLLSLHKMFPDAPLYTSVYDGEKADWARVFSRVIPSFLQNIPYAKYNHEKLALLMPIVFESFCFDHFDLVIASHVLEHSTDPLALFCELARVTKPGGKLYIEAPSDRALLVNSDADVESHSFFSFWDDPTHRRPWPPAALYRLAILYGLIPRQCRYITSLKEKILLPLRRPRIISLIPNLCSSIHKMDMFG